MKEEKKPAAKVGDGNIFAVMGAANEALMTAGRREDAKKMFERVTQSGSYDMALAVISEYVDLELEG